MGGSEMNARVATLIEMSVYLDHAQREGTRIGWRLKQAGLEDAFHAVTPVRRAGAEDARRIRGRAGIKSFRPMTRLTLPIARR